MTFPQESSALARELARLAASDASARLSAKGLSTALSARHGVLVLLRQVLSEATGSNTALDATVAGRPGRMLRSVEELEARPVGVLARALATHPAPSLPLDLDGQAPTGGAEAWRRASRHALLAGHEWSTRPPRLTAAQAWSAVADVAALATALSVVDADLATSARALPGIDLEVTEQLQAAATSGLRTAAGEAAALAAAGPLPAWGEPGPESSPTRVLLVRSPADVAGAQSRIAAQVAAAGDLSPQAVTLVATGQVRVLAAASETLKHVDPARADRARELARSVASVVAGRHRLAALMPDDPRPVVQTRELVQRVATLGRDQGSLAALAAVVDRCPAVLAALSRRGDQALRTGQWLVPNVDAEQAADPLWRKAGREDPEPSLLAGLSGVTARSTAFTPAPAAWTGPGAAPPREVLAGVGALARRSRPQRPGSRGGPGAEQG